MAEKDKEAEAEIFAASVAAAMRALAENAEIDLQNLEAEGETGRVLRGMADRYAFHRRYHDAALHPRHRLKHPETLMAHMLLEQARCEALGTGRMRGTAANMQEAILKEITGDPTPAQKTYLAVWRGLTEYDGSGFPQEQEDVRIAEYLPLLKETLGDQAAFSKLSLSLLKELGFEVSTAEVSEPVPGGEGEDGGEPERGEDPEGGASGDPEALKRLMAMAAAGEAETSASDMQTIRETANALMEEMAQSRAAPENTDHLAQMPQYARQFALEMEDYSYNIFTTEFDTVEQADRLATTDELVELRRYLDDMTAPMQRMIGRFAAKLQRYILARQKHAFQYSYDSGLLDHKRLSEIVINPENPLCYKQTHDTPFRDTVVSLLIDNSGSMRGRPIMTAAVSTEILARTLERCGIRTEILGFTTKHWKGGESQKKWKITGRSATPGRLNDLLHIIYKSADMPWRRARQSLGLMLQDGLLKENIDGEALLWAYDRLRMMPEERKILIVISDGAPIDDATLSSNHGQFLEEHLHKVIHWLENKKHIELLSIGIGHDVTRYYHKAVKITDVNDLAETLVDKMIELLV